MLALNAYAGHESGSSMIIRDGMGALLVYKPQVGKSLKTRMHDTNGPRYYEQTSIGGLVVSRNDSFGYEEGAQVVQ